jgi:hypothetical protein
MTWLTALVDRSANEEHISKRSIWGILLVPPILAVAIFMFHFINRRQYLWLLSEWRPIELLQVVFFGLASLIAFRIALKSWRDNQKIFAVLYFLLGLALFFIAGEEVSWGQPVFRRIFAWWPDRDSLRDINAQGETTIHNMRSVQWVFNWFYLSLALYGSLSPLLFLSRRWRDEPRLRLIAAPMITVPAFLVMAAFMIVRVFIAPYNGLTESESFMRYKEVGELTVAFGLWLFTALNWRWLRLPSDQRAPVSDDSGELALKPGSKGIV